MTEFRTPDDIGNRALQHVGQELMGTSGFSENSKNARQIRACYGKLRRAELQRNVWSFAIRRAVVRPIATSTRMLAPALWSPVTTYFRGSIVIDAYGTPWISQQDNNLNFDPLTTTSWEQYFGPLSVTLYDSTTSYSAGELVYTTPGDGTSRVYLSLVNGNANNPATATAWSATTTYALAQVVTYSSVAYMSKIDLNLNQTPSASAADWASGTTYALDALVNGSDGVTYKSLSGGNLGNDPISSPAFWQNQGFLTPWTTSFVGGTGSLKWLQVGGAEFPMGVGLSPANVLYPIASGPTIGDGNRNVFRKPANFLRMAPRDPKAGSVSPLGAPSGLAYPDWNQEGDFVVSRESQPIFLRFVADVVDVRRMHDMFCEGLGARVGLEICEPLTQSS